jgi:non-heme chloroperoxidase
MNGDPMKTSFDLTRREVIIGSAASIVTLGLPATRAVSETLDGSVTASNPYQHGETAMNTITVKDGTTIYFKDWGTGPVVTFSHGWPLNADAWDAQMLFLGKRGYRVIAHDRRGHGRSGQTWGGNDLDTYADDLAELFEKLDLKDVTMVGHSTGGGEVARYIGRHGNKRVKKAVLIGAIPPIMVKSDKNPGGLPISVFDGIREGVAGNRAQFFLDLSLPFYGYNKPDAKVSEGVRYEFLNQGMQSSIIASYDCVKAFSETDQNEDLKKFEVPTLVLHGDADQIVPIADSAYLSSKIVKNATLKVIAGGPHGMCTTRADEINEALLAFLKA